MGMKTDKPIRGKNPTGIKDVFVFYILGASLLGFGLDFFQVESKLGDVLGGCHISSDSCLLIIIITVTLINGWMGSSTNNARILHDVPWPHTFAPANNKNKTEFDCVQRAHLNFVENIAIFLSLHYGASLDYPYLAFVAAIVFLLGRIVFAKGYYTGNAKNRNGGMFGYAGFFVLLGLCYVTLARKMGVV